jgi:carbonic anhydrase
MQIQTGIKMWLAVALLFTGQAALAGGGKTHWGYTGHTGPAHWGELAAEYALCKTGKQQSPINIASPRPAKLPAIEFHYQPSMLEVINNGHTIQVNYAPGSYIVANGKRYDLLQFHFHTPSEHEINGKPADMVAHLVHKAKDGQLGVVGVLMNRGQANPELVKIQDNMPTQHGERKAAPIKIDAAQLLPGDRSYYQYPGSLTTPPCSEGVNWMVLKTASPASASQVAAFTAVLHKNARPVQPLNGREIRVSK